MILPWQDEWFISAQMFMTKKKRKEKKKQKISEHNLLEVILALENFQKTGWIFDCNSKDKNLIKIEIMDFRTLATKQRERNNRFEFKMATNELKPC